MSWSSFIMCCCCCCWMFAIFLCCWLLFHSLVCRFHPMALDPIGFRVAFFSSYFAWQDPNRTASHAILFLPPQRMYALPMILFYVMSYIKDTVFLPLSLGYFTHLLQSNRFNFIFANEMYSQFQRDLHFRLLASAMLGLLIFGFFVFVWYLVYSYGWYTNRNKPSIEAMKRDFDSDKIEISIRVQNKAKQSTRKIETQMTKIKKDLTGISVNNVTINVHWCLENLQNLLVVSGTSQNIHSCS